jgi:hypothetical protein
LVKPVTVIGDDVPVALCPPDETTVYEVMAPPPIFEGAVNVTEASVFPAVAVPIVGALGVRNGL